MTSSRPPTVSRPCRLGTPGFTLIELLVSIAIISVLMSILLPALSGARKTSRRLLCQTRMRQQGVSMTFYAEAYSSAVPLSESPTMHYAAALLPGLVHTNMNSVGELFRRSGNHLAFTKMLGQVETLQCPDFPNDDQKLDFVVNAFSRPYTRGNDPGMPGSSPSPDPSNDRSLWLSLTRLEKTASDWIYLTEAHKDLPTDTPWMHDVFSSAQLPLASFPRIANDMRHPIGLNALFFDTHVESMRHQRMDIGWPHSLSMRMRYFAPVEQ